MNICIIAPSQEYLGLAGVRIRYLRIADRLAELGHTMVIEVIDQFRSLDQFTHDVYVFSKCYDARGFVVCEILRNTDKLVGIDMFDDYFSQHDDSRFICHRDWLRTMAGHVDFFLCSTQRMKDVVAQYMPDMPGHILNDPFDRADAQAIARNVKHNLERTLFTKELDVGWFGVGDNPHFAVGLRDLHAFGPALAALGHAGWSVNLRILTNRRALSADGLELLGRLPVPWSLDEWSVSAETALLATSLVAFIPVNAQGFSIAKSLNRAVSALTAGTQVLSNGFPLYDALGAFIYRTPEALADDLKQRKLLLREDTVPSLLASMAACGDPAHEAQSYARFLVDLGERKRQRRRGMARSQTVMGVVHGVRSQGAVHQFAQRVKQLSVSSPFSNPGLNYDMRFVPDGAALHVQFSKLATPHLRPEIHKRVTAGVSATGRDVKSLDIRPLLPAAAAVIQQGFASTAHATRLASYAGVMAAIREVAQALLAQVEIRVSENEPPYSALGAAATAPTMKLH